MRFVSNDDDTIDCIYGTTAEMDKFESLPAEILTTIFSQMDDIGLLRVASTCRRFQAVAQEVFKFRYENEYFLIKNESEQMQKQYQAQFKRFGSGIKAIKAYDIEGIEKNHWMAQMLQKHVKKLNKLVFYNCSFNNTIDILLPHMHLEHLAFVGGWCKNDGHVRLPKYRNLKKLEFNNFHNVMASTLKRTFLKNPHLECLILKYCGFTMSRLFELVHKYLKHLKELNINDNFDFSEPIGLPTNKSKEKFVQSLKNVESLGMSLDDETLDVMERLSANCKSIKHLEVYVFDDEWIDVIRKFDRVESLALIDMLKMDRIESLVEHLKHLRVLSVDRFRFNEVITALSWLRKSATLEKLTIGSSSGYNQIEHPRKYHNFNAHFHDEFVKSIQNQRAKLYIKQGNKTIGVITKDEIIWRDMLVHWIGYDPIYNNQSKLTLLDLAEQPPDTEQKSPLEKIFNYLDLSSLYAVCRTSKKCKLLVERYAENHSMQNGPFIISDQFNINYNGLHALAKYVTNLHVCSVSGSTRPILQWIRTFIEESCSGLRKLKFENSNRCSDPHDFTFPNLLHYVYNGPFWKNRCVVHCDLTQFSNVSPHLEILEFETIVKMRISCKSDSFHNLKTFKFKPFDESQMNLILNLFKNTNTQVVVVV